MKYRILLPFSISLLVLSGFGFYLLTGTEATQAQTPNSENLFEVLNQKARVARNANANATDVQDLVETIVQVTGFKDYVVGQTGNDLKDRVKRAEISYRQGQQQAITELKVALALNDLKTQLNTPDYSGTTEYEVRRLRVAVLPMFPELIGRGQLSGNVAATGDKLPVEMSPAEAVFVLSSLLFQKMNNPDYQLTATERANLWATEHDYAQNFEASLAQRSVDNPHVEQMKEAVSNGFLLLPPTNVQNMPKRIMDILGLQP